MLGPALALTAGPALAFPDAPRPHRDLAGSTLHDFSSDVGQWMVSPDSAGGWRVSWTAPQALPVVDARPRVVLGEQVGDLPAGAVLGDATVGEDGRTVSLRVPGGPAPDPDDLDVQLGSQVLDEPVADAVQAPVADGPAAPRATTADPGAEGGHRVVTSDYTQPGIKLPGLRDPVEMVGHVEAPADASRTSPLVVLLHGRHPTCFRGERQDLVWPCSPGWDPVPNHLGFHYLQRRLASQGFVTVSVSANGINAQDGGTADGGALARARLVQAHLDLWARWVAEGRRKADLSDVVLLGHSRGGEGMAVAGLEIPMSAAYRVRGLVLLAPTDLARRATPYLPTVTLLPSCDGDVVDLQGQAYTDVAPGLAAGDTALHSSVMIVGANHNYFSSEWTPGTSRAPAEDDWFGTTGPCARKSPRRLSGLEQRRVVRTYVAGAVRLLARDSTSFLPMYDGSRVSVPSAGDAVVLSHAVGAGRPMRRPGTSATLTTPAGGAEAQLCRGVTPAAWSEQACGRFADDPWLQTPHWPTSPVVAPTRQALELGWMAAGARAGLRFASPWDVSGVRALDLRTVVDPGRGPVRLGVRLTDASGHATTVTPVGEGRLSPLPSGGETPGRFWAQALRVPLSGVTAVDLDRLAQVELVARSERGRVWVLDVSGVRSALPAVPARRVPLVDLGSVTLKEGDSGTMARLPYRVRGTLSRTARLRIGGLRALDGRMVARPVVDLPAGTTRGTLSWPVPANRRDSLARTQTRVTAYGVSEVVARDAVGTVTVLDDDPPPRVRVRTVRSTVSEGGTLRWEVTWSPRSDYAPFVSRRVVPAASGRSVTSNDLPVRFPMFQEFALGDPSTPRWVIRVPVRRDGRREPRELVRIRVAIPQFGFRTTLSGVVRAGR